MAYDLFISYASEDKTIADAVCARLESAGIRCWIAPRDITAGKSYGEAIIEAIREVKVMVLVFSSSANSSVHIPKEVERAVSKGVPIIPFRIEDVAAGNSLDYFIGSVHWLDAMTPPMEKHLDDLAATIHKLFPAQAGERPQPPSQASAAWQRSAPPVAPIATPIAANRSASGGDTARASSSKTIWIGVAVVAVLVAVVIGTMLLRGGGNSRSAADIPSMANSSTGPSAGGDSNPANNAGPSSASPAVAVSGVDPIVGCYVWFNNGSVVIHENGTMVGGPFTARWQLVSASRRAYTFTWPLAVDTVKISPDQETLAGGNQYGYPTSGRRITGNSGLVGTWRWPNGLPVTVNPDGTVSTASFRGKWQAIDAPHGIYTITWPSPVDSVTLAADGSSLSGSNQYGVAISGVRTRPCNGN